MKTGLNVIEAHYNDEAVCAVCGTVYIVFYAVIYSLEYSGILYMFMCPYPCQYGEPADFLSIQFMQNTPFNGAGGDWLITPS